jgi:hypothetical protein
MRYLIVVLTLGLLPVLFFSSCLNDNTLDEQDEFRIEFNDGTLIAERDILFYDRSTHLVYLKRDLELTPNARDFTVSVAGDSIFNGVIYSCNLSSMPPTPYFIDDCFHYGNNILGIGYQGESNDLRNDPRITDAFKNRNLLRNGISCRIDKVEIVSFENYSRVICTITIQNNDNINYYILDPGKMGDLDFTYFTGGLTLRNMGTKLSYPLRWSVQSGTWSNINTDDLSLLKGGSKVTYTFQSSDYHKMEQGTYSARFRFCGTEHCTRDIKLDQKNGRVWVGQLHAEIDNIMVKNQGE